MPVTFATSPPGHKPRRPSASSPFPGRVMTGLRPTDYPARSKSGRRGSATGAESSVGQTASQQHPPEHPFETEDASGSGSYSQFSNYESTSFSPQEERIPLAPDDPRERVDNNTRPQRPQPSTSRLSAPEDPERQPLLGVSEEDEENDDDNERSATVAWGVTLCISLGIAIVTVLIFVGVKLGEEGRFPGHGGDESGK